MIGWILASVGAVPVTVNDQILTSVGTVSIAVIGWIQASVGAEPDIGWYCLWL